MRRAMLIVPLLAVLCALVVRPALADTRAVYHGGVYFGSVVVEPGQIVEGDLTVVFGDAVTAPSVNTDSRGSVPVVPRRSRSDTTPATVRSSITTRW